MTKGNSVHVIHCKIAFVVYYVYVYVCVTVGVRGLFVNLCVCLNGIF